MITDIRLFSVNQNASFTSSLTDHSRTSAQHPPLDFLAQHKMHEQLEALQHGQHNSKPLASHVASSSAHHPPLDFYAQHKMHQQQVQHDGKTPASHGASSSRSASNFGVSVLRQVFSN